MRIHCLEHLEFESLGNINQWVKSRGHTLTRSLPYADDFFPEPGDFDLLIIMGGLMSVYEEDSYPWLKTEKEFVKRCLDSEKAIFGICFGAQMLAEILGSKVSKNDHKEIGWHRVSATGGNGNAAFLLDLPPEFTVFQWHGDTFALPGNTTRLFESEACREQGFIYRDNVLAVQFHPETNEGCVKDLLENCRTDLVDGRYIQKEEDIVGRAEFVKGSAALMFSILDWFESIYSEKTTNIIQQNDCMVGRQ